MPAVCVRVVCSVCEGGVPAVCVCEGGVLAV